MEIGETSITSAQGEANVLIELRGELEVPRGKMGLEFNCDKL
jgi:hypothetical protein